MSKTDDQVWAELIEKVQNGLKKMELPPLKHTSNHVDVGMKYRSSGAYAGYTDTNFKDRSNEIEIRFQTDSEDEMLFYILNNEASSYGFNYEYENRKKLEREWRYHFMTDVSDIRTGKATGNCGTGWKYDLRYDGRKYWFELEIQKLNRVYPLERLEELIRNRTKLMNRWFNKPRWRFDKERMVFTEVSDEPEYD